MVRRKNLSNLISYARNYSKINISKLFAISMEIYSPTAVIEDGEGINIFAKLIKLNKNKNEKHVIRQFYGVQICNTHT